MQFPSPLPFTSGAGAPFLIKKLREHLRWADAQTVVTKHLMSAIRTSLSKGVTGRALVPLVSNTTLGLGLRSGLSPLQQAFPGWVMVTDFQGTWMNV